MATTIQNIELPKKPRARDTSGNNNHGEIYSGRGLEFDGVTDYFQNNGGLPLAGVNYFADGVPWTFACWIYFDSSSTSTHHYFVGNDFTTHPMLIFQNQNNVNKLIFRAEDAGKDYYLFPHGHGPSLNKMDQDAWHRLVVTTDGVSLTAYVNGVHGGDITDSQDDVLADVTFSNTGMDFSGWGSPYQSGGVRQLNFKGMMSDGQVWDATWSADDAAYDYANPESLALNASGSALTEGNLKLWYPMQDGHRGQQSYILDGANTGEGVEELTNGSFTGITQAESTTGSEWITGTGWTISGGAAVAGGTTASLAQNGILKPLSVYKVTATVTGDPSLLVFTGASFYNSLAERTLLNGTHTYYLQAETANFSITNAADNACTIDNISVKPINDKHHATTVFYGDELVTNGTFTSATTGWQGNDAASAISIVSNRLRVTNGDASAGGFSTTSGSPTFSTITGRTYLISYDSLQGTSANPNTTLFLGTSFNGSEVHTGTTYTSDGTHTYTFTATASQDVYLLIKNATTTNGQYMDYDNVSVKEVGVASGWTDADQQLHIPQTALQSYNELAWFDGTIASDGYVDLDSAITTSGNSWSLSFWVFHDDNGQDFDIILGDGANQFIALNKDDDDKLQYRDSSNGYHAISDAAIPESEWVHITIAATANTSITAYVNGVAQATNSDMTNTTLLLERFMRGYSNANYQTFGTINEISYYSDVLTSAEALDLFNDGKAKSALEASGSAGLVGYWRNNGLSTWTDLKGSNNGTPTSVTETILIPEGVDTTRDSQGFLMNKKRSTGSLNLTNGYDNPYVDLGSTTTVADDEAFSIMMWLKPDDVVTNYFFGKNSTTDYIKINDSTTFILRADGVSKVFTVGTIIAKDWIHVAFVRKAADDVVSIYVNGDAADDTEVLNEPFDYRYIGAMKVLSDNFRGAVDGFLIYNTELDETEVLKNYNATKRDHKN